MEKPMKQPLTKNECIHEVVVVEGGYVDDPNDLGGETNYGITKETAMKYKHWWAHYKWDGNMRTMPVDFVYAVYDVEYWQRLNLDTIAKRSVTLASRLFDFGVNAGIANAAQALQRSLNVLNKQGTLYPDIELGTIIGPVTLKAFEGYANTVTKDSAGFEKLTLMIYGLQIAHYVKISEERQKNEDFTRGWVNRVWKAFWNYAEWLTP
jgi:lysozyme family protein